MSVTIVNTTRRIYWFNEDLTLFEITDTDDIFYDIPVEEPVNEGQFRNLYIVTNNYRAPKKWNSIDAEVEDLGGLSAIGVIRARTLEINNNHVIFGNIAKNGGGPGGAKVIDAIPDIIDTVTTIIDAFGTTEETGYQRFNKSVIWSDINRPEYYLPELNNQAGDIDFDEDGYELIRIKKLSEINVVYKERSIWLMIHVGLPFVYVKKFHTEAVGLLAVNAIIEINNVHYFVGHDFDIYRFDGINLVNLSMESGIREYIKARVNHDTVYQTHAYADLERKEIKFSFFGKLEIDNTYRQFDIVYNYQNNQFFRRDSIAKCGGYFTQKLDFDTIDEKTELIDSVFDSIDFFGFRGSPKRKLLIGDREGQLHLYNHTDSFNGDDIYATLETGDEDFSEPSRGALANRIKILEQIKLLIDNEDINLEFDVYVGGRNSMDGKINWFGPYHYPQNASRNGLLKTRAFGVYQRLKFISPNANQFIRILGYVSTAHAYGKSVR